MVTLRLYIIILGLIICSMSYAKTISYGEPVVLEGKILIIKSLDDEQFKDAKYPAIRLNKQITVNGNNDEINQGEIKTKLLQLVDVNHARYNKYYKYNGRDITVYCEELFRSHTIHHNTKVLCVVDNIKWK